MIKYIKIVLFGYLAVISINIAQEDQIDIRSVNISGNESIKKKELMPLLRQRPSNFSFTFKGTSFNNRLLKMDGLTLKNYFISMAKDLQTPMGIPLHNIENIEAYNELASKISSTFFIKKQWLYDFQSVDVLEVLSSTIGVVALFFGWKKKEKEEFAELCASLGLAGAVGANPFLLIIALIALAKSYTQNKNKNKFKRGSLRGFVGMGSFIMTASLFSSPLLGIIIGLVVAIILKKKMKEMNFSEIYEWFKENIKKYAETISNATGIKYLYNKIKNFA